MGYHDDITIVYLKEYHVANNICYNPLNDPGNQRELVVILRCTSFWVNYNFTATEPWNHG